MGISWTAGHVESDGERIWWEGANLEADAPTLVFGHGAGGSHAVWFQQVPHFAKRFRVVTWDTRGFGRSSFTTGRFGADESVADLAAVLDASRTEQAHIAAQSMGGWWLSGFVLAHPDRVLSLSYLDTPGGLMTDAMRVAFAEFRQSGGLVGPTEVGAHRALAPDFNDRHPDLAFLYQQIGGFAEPPMRQVGEVLGGTEFEVESIAALGKPTLVLAGDQDGIFPSRLLEELAPLLGASWIEIAGAGHSPYFERADDFNQALGGFLATAIS